MEVKHQQNGNRGRFYIEENGKAVATMTYVFSGDTKFIIEHTVVDESQSGKGLGKMLVKAAVEFARSNHYKILPDCPYARAVIEKTPEYQDVLF
jgi:predicted GNAT family acetyltransferase